MRWELKCLTQWWWKLEDREDTDTVGGACWLAQLAHGHLDSHVMAVVRFWPDACGYVRVVSNIWHQNSRTCDLLWEWCRRFRDHGVVQLTWAVMKIFKEHLVWRNLCSCISGVDGAGDTLLVQLLMLLPKLLQLLAMTSEKTWPIWIVIPKFFIQMVGSSTSQLGSSTRTQIYPTNVQY